MSKTAITLLAVLMITAQKTGCVWQDPDKMTDSKNTQTPIDGPNSLASSQPQTPAPPEKTQYQKATFAAGCFWGVEASFRAVEGVVDTRVGYTGGTSPYPTYKQVCTDKTGHAEAVEITFDPNKVSFEQLLDIFWKIHDPTTLNRQGPDVGTQYRSAVFCHTEQQKDAALASIKKLRKTRAFKKPIVTQVLPAGEFHQAEEYHQRYLEKQGKTSCSSTIH
ncbi:MAG: peptide-methionine (S)-S-oxide reductase MsrA [Sedimentisphaerales bacterium]|nr:peptide-methionine (S)-S-oxide reductase MsrA [Sedimentisphaerales bacterium]